MRGRVKSHLPTRYFKFIQLTHHQTIHLHSHLPQTYILSLTNTIILRHSIHWIIICPTSKPAIAFLSKHLLSEQKKPLFTFPFDKRVNTFMVVSIPTSISCHDWNDVVKNEKRMVSRKREKRSWNENGNLWLEKEGVSKMEKLIVGLVQAL